MRPYAFAGRQTVYPPSAAAFREISATAALPAGLDLDSLYLANEDSGNLIDQVQKPHNHKSAATAAWDSGASSVQTLAGDGYVEFVAYSDVDEMMIGLSTVDTNANFNTIEYAININNAGEFAVWESGVKKNDFAAYTIGDTFRVRRVGTAIDYLRNGVSFYTSAATESDPLMIDTSIYQAGGYVTMKLIDDGDEVAVTWQNVTGVSVSKDLIAADSNATIVYNEKKNGHRGIGHKDANDKHYAVVNNFEFMSGIYGWIGTLNGNLTQDNLTGTFTFGTDYAMAYWSSGTVVSWRLVVGVNTVHINLASSPPSVPDMDDRQWLGLFRVNRNGDEADALLCRRGSPHFSGSDSLAGLGRLTLSQFGPGDYNGGGVRHFDYLFSAVGPQVELLDLPTLAAQLGFTD